MRLTNNFFSHIYIERRAADYSLTADILKRFPDAQLIFVSHYKDVFNRPGQSFAAQKKSRKLILAVKEPPFLYRGSEFCFREAGRDSYYTTPALNCVYDCDYCFLQGMYVTANLVIFVNTDDFRHEASERILEKPAHLSISYETDLPAIENIAPLCSVWIDWASAHNQVSMEIRTKSSFTGNFKQLTPNPQTILAWTLSPQTVIDRYEHRTPPLKRRIESVNSAINSGWKVRLCWDPLIYFPEWETAYQEAVRAVSLSVPPGAICDVQVGLFRMNAGYLKNLQRQRADTDVLYQVFERTGDAVSYPPDVRQKMTDRMVSALTEFFPPERIRITG